MFTKWKQSPEDTVIQYIGHYCRGGGTMVLCVFFVVECQCDLKLLTAPDAYTAPGSCCLSSSIICIDGYSPSAGLTVRSLLLFSPFLAPPPPPLTSAALAFLSVCYLDWTSPCVSLSCSSSVQGFHRHS